MLVNQSKKTCTDCGLTKPVSDFYASKNHAFGVMCYCKICFNLRCSMRWVQRKIKAIHYKGSNCQRCNLSVKDTHYAVFEFHHLNPAHKDFNWAKLRIRPWEEIQKELDKCVLLCANCHRIVHAELFEREGFPDQPESQKRFRSF